MSSKPARRAWALAPLFVVALMLACGRGSSSSGGSAALLPITPERFEAKCADCKETCAIPAADACFQLGVMLETGSNGVTKDQARARELYQRAAKAGHPGARAKLRDKAPGL